MYIIFASARLPARWRPSGRQFWTTPGSLTASTLLRERACIHTNIHIYIYVYAYIQSTYDRHISIRKPTRRQGPLTINSILSSFNNDVSMCFVPHIELCGSKVSVEAGPY